MAQIKSVGFNTPRPTFIDGRGGFLTDKWALAANPTAADTLDTKIPAGQEICTVELQCDDLDSNGSQTFVFSVGYAPVNPASATPANPTYFAGTGQTTAQSGGGRLRCAFKPITFQEDMYLRVTVGTASATFASGEIHSIVGVNHHGPR